MTPGTKVFLEGLTFGEGPRWRDGKLWFSDFHTKRVMTVDPEGRTETITEVPGMPSGLGWLPDGRLLVVSMTDRRLLRLDPGGLVEVADLSGLAAGHCNDMVVDRQGRAYIGHFGFNIFIGESVAPACVMIVTPDGEACVVAEDMYFPNGSVITPDGGTLIVAESMASRLTAFDIETDGSLTGRRVWAKLGEAYPAGITSPKEHARWTAANVLPDGICLDAENAIWVADSSASQVLRVREGGEVTERIETSAVAYACMLGGADRRTLFIMTAETENPGKAKARMSGRIETVEVAVPGVGLP